MRVPAARNPASIIAHVDPLPLVPATCTQRQAQCGLPRAWSKAVMRSSLLLAVSTSLPSE